MVDDPARAEHDPSSGAWQLLLARLSGWIASADVESLWGRLRRPLTLLGWLLAALIVLKIYGAVLSTIDSVPLMGGLLELAGVIWLCRFAVERLLRSSDRRQLLDALEVRWSRFRGQG